MCKVIGDPYKNALIFSEDLRKLREMANDTDPENVNYPFSSEDDI